MTPALRALEAEDEAKCPRCGQSMDADNERPCSICIGCGIDLPCQGECNKGCPTCNPAEDEAEKCPVKGCVGGEIKMVKVTHSTTTGSNTYTVTEPCTHPSHKPAADTKGGE